MRCQWRAAWRSWPATGRWSPLLLLAGLIAASVGLDRLAIGGFAPAGRLPAWTLLLGAFGLVATLFSGRAAADEEGV